jgi:hypothetical protein
MVQFTQCGFLTLFYSGTECWNHFQRVTPFGYPGITGYVLLPLAYRSLSRPSSPRSSKASTIHLYSLDHIIVSSSIASFTHHQLVQAGLGRNIISAGSLKLTIQTQGCTLRFGLKQSRTREMFPIKKHVSLLLMCAGFRFRPFGLSVPDN